jgi:hypothetical protein
LSLSGGKATGTPGALPAADLSAPSVVAGPTSQVLPNEGANVGLDMSGAVVCCPVAKLHWPGDGSASSWGRKGDGCGLRDWEEDGVDGKGMAGRTRSPLFGGAANETITP